MLHRYRDDGMAGDCENHARQSVLLRVRSGARAAADDGGYLGVGESGEIVVAHGKSLPVGSN